MMLKTYLKSLPPTKFVLIEDTYNENGKEIFNYLLNTHRTKTTKIHYLVFEGVYQKTVTQLTDFKNIVFYDFVTSNANTNLEHILRNVGNEIVVIDSLAHALIKHNVPFVYKLLNDLCRKKHVLQVLTTLHLDLLEEVSEVSRTFEHLCTLSLKVEPKLHSENMRVAYVYKIGRKVVREIEEFRFVDGELISETLKRLDSERLIRESLAVNPETLTTFKIGLEVKEKKEREKLVLPYLPKTKDDDSGPKIFYELDGIDDWDEEDPDDDLDI